MNCQPTEKIKLRRLPDLGNLELLRATYVRQHFAKHTHDGFAVGVIEHGALGFYYRGENVVAPAGAVNLANPDEPHTGQAASEAGWTYRMFYMDAELLRKAASEIAGRPASLPFFQSGVLHDPHLARLIHSLHQRLEAGDAPALEKESGLLRMLTRLITRHADAPPALHPIGREPGRVKRVREYIEAHYDQDLSVDQLASVAHLSPFHFIRVFGKETGLPPHAYLIQARVKHARALLKKGWPVSAAALETGFADQSHLTRHFKRITGITPGQYRRIVQDA